MPALGKPTVVAREISKTYQIGADGSHNPPPWKKTTKVEALRPLSFVARSGECIGILGRNGSGKSTLVSIIAGNEDPTTGSVFVSSNPSLLSVSAALQPHLSGIENVRLGLLAKGLSPEEVDEMAYPVAEWSEIGEAIHRPINTYSSGMAARLKFSIATAVRPEILLLDEALSTGDSTFNQRAHERMDGFLDGASTVFVVSHSVSTIRRHCTRVLWLHNGTLVTDVPPSAAVKWYTKWSDAEATGDVEQANGIIEMLQRFYVPDRIFFEKG